MIELPESQTLAKQLQESVKNKQITEVIANHSPHKFAWYHGDPNNYHSLLAGKTIYEAAGYGSMVEIQAGDAFILLGEGIALRYYENANSYPKKHQLLIRFEDDSAVSGSVQMYGGLWAFKADDFDNIYYKLAKEKPSPLSEDFDENYFDNLLKAEGISKLSTKAFLATEQRIPGLGNGILQDILWNAKLHPKHKMNTLDSSDIERLYTSVKDILSSAVAMGGRDTEKNLYGENGSYKTVMSKNNAGSSCPECGGLITKESYMGGSIYFCPDCQRL
jgi:formamidopyrimidine-DNA glycosylase